MSISSKGITQTLAEVLQKVSLETYESVAFEMFELRKADKITVDLSVSEMAMGVDREILEGLSKKYEVDSDLLRKMLSSIGLLLRNVIAEDRDETIRNLKENEKLVDKAEKLIEIGEKLTKRYPEVSERFAIISFCKTSFFKDVDWEIVLKVMQPDEVGFEKRDRFLVCVLRFLLGRSRAIVRPDEPEEKAPEFVFEATTGDINRLIVTLSRIRDKMLETKKELLVLGETN